MYKKFHKYSFVCIRHLTFVTKAIPAKKSTRQTTNVRMLLCLRRTLGYSSARAEMMASTMAN